MGIQYTSAFASSRSYTITGGWTIQNDWNWNNGYGIVFGSATFGGAFGDGKSNEGVGFFTDDWSSAYFTANNNYLLFGQGVHFQGLVVFEESSPVNIQFGTTTGTKIGTSTTQKIGFFNATPIVQQTTTSQTPSTFAANTSGIANDSATWDGYTIGDIVKILRVFGLIA